MTIVRFLKTKIYNLIRSYRYAVVRGLLDREAKSLLNVGCGDCYFRDKLKHELSVTLADSAPLDDRVLKEDVQNLSFPDGAFDIVLCLQVLEHVPDPVRAMLELKRVAARQLVISVPYEPFFTLARLGHWERGHLWAIRPAALKSHLGEPVCERRMFFKRYYVASWMLE